MASFPPLSKQQHRLSQAGALHLYRELAVGEGGWGGLVTYEVITGLGSILPGLVGLGIRSICYRPLFRSCGSRPYLGRGITIRNPGAMTLGKKVFIDEGTTLDCRKGSKISLGDWCAIGKGSIVAAKGGDILIGAGANIGTFCRVATESSITVGESTLIAAYCYIGPGNHTWDEEQGTFISGAMEQKGGVTIGKNCWIGTRATILDGVTIGDGAVVGAHSLVKDDVPAGATVVGAPAKRVGAPAKRIS